MTIIQPKKQGKRITIALIFMFAAVISGVSVGIFLYSMTVDLRHEVAVLEGEIQSFKVRNAELKEGLYEILDARRLEALGVDFGLILDRNPRYVETALHVLAASR